MFFILNPFQNLTRTLTHLVKCVNSFFKAFNPNIDAVNPKKDAVNPKKDAVNPKKDAFRVCKTLILNAFFLLKNKKKQEKTFQARFCPCGKVDNLKFSFQTKNTFSLKSKNQKLRKNGNSDLKEFLTSRKT